MKLRRKPIQVDTFWHMIQEISHRSNHDIRLWGVISYRPTLTKITQKKYYHPRIL